MKKLLLVLTLVAMACSSAWAAGLLLKKDPNGYEKVNGIGMRNLWLLDRFHYGVNELQTDFEWCNTKARTAVLQDGVVYVARSEAKQYIVPGANGNDTIMGAVIYRFDAMTGEQMARSWVRTQLARTTLVMCGLPPTPARRLPRCHCIY